MWFSYADLFDLDLLDVGRHSNFQVEIRLLRWRQRYLDRPENLILS